MNMLSKFILGNPRFLYLYWKNTELEKALVESATYKNQT